METIDSYEDFSSVIDSEDKVLIDFFAPWCSPCRRMEPIIEELSEDYPIKKVNVDSVPEVAEDYNVMALPTLAVFEDGEEEDRKTGFQDKKKIKNFYK